MSTAHQIATEHASRDREATALLLLDLACKEAVGLIRDGRPGRARYVLARAGGKADRLIPTRHLTSTRIIR